MNFYDDYEEPFVERSGLKKILDCTGISVFWEKYWKILAIAVIVPVLMLYLPFCLQKGVRFEGKFYKVRQTDNGFEFGGRSYMDEFRIQVDRADDNLGFVTYKVGNRVQEYWVELSGEKDLLIYQNDELYFEGTREPMGKNGNYALIKKDDSPEENWIVTVNGMLPSELGVRQVYDLCMEELTTRGGSGNFGFALCALFIWIIWVIDIWFPRFFFLLEHCMSVNNPEPSDWFLFGQKVGWVIMPIAAVVLLVMSLL